MNILYIGMLNKSIARWRTRQKLFQGEMHKLIGLLDMRSMVITVPECNGPTRTMSNGSAVTCLIIVSYGTYIGFNIVRQNL